MINFQELEKVAEFKNGKLNWLEGRDINAVYVMLVGDEYYIGSSHYTYLRIGQHLDKLLKGKHHSCRFQEKFNMVGEFEVYSLDRGIEKGCLYEMEFYYIEKYKPSLNSIHPKIKKRIIEIKDEDEYGFYRKKIEELLAKSSKFGDVEFLSEEDKNEYCRLIKAVTEYEHAFHPLPGKFSTLLINKICERMEERFINQKELAKMLGISESRMSDILSNKRQINLKIAREIRNKLDISADFILDCYCCK